MGRGGRLGAHRARVYLITHLACEVAFLPHRKYFRRGPRTRRDLQERAQNARCASLAERPLTSTPIFPIWTLGDVDTWGRVYFVHFLDILNMSPNVQNRNIHCYLSLHIFFFLNSSLALALFFKTLLFAEIFSPAILFHLPNIRPFIDISLSNLDTWGRVYFVHFLDILNTSPSVQIGKVVLKVLWK